MNALEATSSTSYVALLPVEHLMPAPMRPACRGTCMEVLAPISMYGSLLRLP